MGISGGNQRVLAMMIEEAKATKDEAQRAWSLARRRNDPASDQQRREDRVRREEWRLVGLLDAWRVLEQGGDLYRAGEV